MERTVLETTASFDRVATRMDATQLYEHFNAKVPVVDTVNAVGHMIDLNNDLLFKIADALIAAGTLTLSAAERASYDKIKAAVAAAGATTLARQTWEVDWAYGVKGTAEQARKDYFAKKTQFGMPL